MSLSRNYLLWMNSHNSTQTLIVALKQCCSELDEGYEDYIPAIRLAIKRLAPLVKPRQSLDEIIEEDGA